MSCSRLCRRTGVAWAVITFALLSPASTSANFSRSVANTTSTITAATLQPPTNLGVSFQCVLIGILRPTADLTWTPTPSTATGYRLDRYKGAVLENERDDHQHVDNDVHGRARNPKPRFVNDLHLASTDLPRIVGVQRRNCDRLDTTHLYLDHIGEQMSQPSFHGPRSTANHGLRIGLARRCGAFAGAIALTLSMNAGWHATVAGAAVQSFAMSPTSGPPGTSVHVSGTGCSPGLLLAPSQDFVQVASATVPPTSTRFAVTTNGSWSGNFVVPTNAAALPAAVTALCVSDGLQSLLTIYTPATFTVTTAPTTTTATTPATTPATAPATTPTTNRSTPTTHPHSGSTTPGSSSGGGTPTSEPPGGTVSTPGDGTGGSVIGNIGGNRSGSTTPGNAGSGVGTSVGDTTAPSATGSGGATAGAKAAHAADLERADSGVVYR